MTKSVISNRASQLSILLMSDPKKAKSFLNEFKSTIAIQITLYCAMKMGKQNLIQNIERIQTLLKN